ncbi:MAG: efflux RND transporter periplasmic adaptor subunit [Anaerotignaceae bacterium]
MKKISISKKLVRNLIIVAVVAAVGITAYSTALGMLGTGKTEERLVPPSLSEVTVGDVQQKITASGTTAAADPYSIFIELSQEVKDVYVEVGDYVEEGQLLVTYDIDETRKKLQDQLEQAEITLSNAQLSLEEITAPAEGTELLDLKTAIINAENNLEDAKKASTDLDKDLAESEANLPYYKQLYDAGSISKVEYENYEKAHNTLLESKTTKEKSITTAELALEKAQLNLENSQNKLNDTATANNYQRQLNTIKTAQTSINSIKEEISKLTEATYSPISGTIIESNAVEGQMLTDSTVMMKVADLTDLNVSAYVSEYDIARVAVGQKVELTSDGIEDTVYMGTVTKIQPTAVSQSTISGSETVVPIVVHMDAPDSLVKPGFSFDIEIIVVDLTNVDYLPISTLVKDKETDSYYVFVVNEQNVLEKTYVEIGTMSNLYAQVISGVSVGTKLFANPDNTVVDGANLMDYGTVEVVPVGSTNDSGLLGGLLPSGGASGGRANGGNGGPPAGGGGGAPGGRG